MGRAALLSLSSLVLVLSLAGCGGTSTGSPGTTNPPPHVPSLHVIFPDTVAPLLPAQTFIAFGQIVLPVATVSYAITERTTTLTQDSFTVGVASAAQVSLLQAGQNYTAYALQVKKRGGFSASDTVPADTYYFVVTCENQIDDCVYSYALSATY